MIDTLLAGRSALAVFPTGGGKSLCYQLPALLLDGLTVVVSPLIALMKDQIDALTRDRRRRRAPRLERRRSTRRGRSPRGSRRATCGCCTSPRSASTTSGSWRCLERTRIALFAVDEAHCISEWGHNFRPDYLKLARRARELGAERVLALTATATPQVRARHLRRLRDRRGGRRGDRLPPPQPRAAHDARHARDPRGGAARPARGRGRPGPSIVYVTFQRQAVDVARALAGAGLPARAYHAGMATADRDGRAGVVGDGRPRHRGGHDRVRHGHRQAPTSATCSTTACPSRSRATRRRRAAPAATGCPRSCELLACADDVPGARELRLRRHADPRRARRPGRRAAAQPRGRAVRRRGVRPRRPPRHAAARAADGAHVPRAGGRAQPGHAVLRRLPDPAADHVRRRLRAVRRRAGRRSCATS